MNHVRARHTAHNSTGPYLRTDPSEAILQELHEALPITGADLVEVAPFIKHMNHQNNTIEPESTLMVSASFCSFLIGAMASPRRK